MAVKKKYANTKSALGRGLDEIEGGRGLDALIDTTGVKTQGSSTINEVAINEIEANPNQPRREFDPVALQELADSITQIGIIQPITLRQMPGGKYQIVAGERRWRASQLAGLTTIPAYIRTIADENVMEMALVENIQREDLNDIEIALAYQHLSEATGMTQERISARVGKNLYIKSENLQKTGSFKMCIAIHRQPVGSDQTLQRNPQKRLLRAQGRGVGEALQRRLRRQEAHHKSTDSC